MLLNVCAIPSIDTAHHIWVHGNDFLENFIGIYERKEDEERYYSKGSVAERRLSLKWTSKRKSLKIRSELTFNWIGIWSSWNHRSNVKCSNDEQTIECQL